MKHFLLLCLLTCAAGSVEAQPSKTEIYHDGWIDLNKNGRRDIYEDRRQAVERRVENLLRQMTLDEKTAQMATLYGSGRVLKDALPTPAWHNEVWKDGIGNIDEQHNGLGKFRSTYSYPYARSVEARHAVQRWFVEQTRLGIPVDFTNEGIRGLCHDRATSFPAQCGQGASWNRQLIAQIAAVEASEARALGYTNIYSPILDLAQDPRWGRVVECYGEDPYLVSELGREMILGLQRGGVVSTPKHFGVYSVPVGGRDGDTRTDPKVAPREMHTLYLEPFRVAFEEAGAKGVMSSYNDYDGIPITGSRYFLTELLRERWGFRGYVVSDSEAVEFIKTKHRIVERDEEMVAEAVNAGLNIRTNFTPPADFILPLRRAVQEGLISERTIDDRVRDILRVKFELGLFDNPYLGDPEEADRLVHCEAHQALSLEAARQSLVLLKNEANLLPLDKTILSLAVIGPNADEVKELICRYGPANTPIISVLEGLRQHLPNTEIRYAKGCEIVDPHFPMSEIMEYAMTTDEERLLHEAVEVAQASEVVVLVLGGSERTVRESRSRTDLRLPGRQEELLKAVLKAGRPTVLVMVDGRAATINYAQAHVPAILHAWFPGEKMGLAIAEALFGDYNPGGKLPVTFPKTVGQLPYAFPFKPGVDVPSESSISGALYPFGYGLSYTTFHYDDLRISKAKIGPQEELEVSCTITNTGERTGDEVVQLYLNDCVSSVTTYTKVLRGFERITLRPKESRRVTFRLDKQDLGLWNRENRFVVEPGCFEVMIGSSSQDIRLDGSFEVIE
ncbi:MAG: glycoside hydrolase family 3 C-terminal domain-containing protein [Alistipes sp.]|nr:glycoside hydrolase family 3 C-terminal domain-containing protein [Alistipes sp.]